MNVIEVTLIFKDFILSLFSRLLMGMFKSSLFIVLYKDSIRHCHMDLFRAKKLYANNVIPKNNGIGLA